METKPDGGAAFPEVETDLEWSEGRNESWNRVYSSGGMSLRDYFAGQALTGAFRGGDTDIADETFARRCYELADAMLAEREK